MRDTFVAMAELSGDEPDGNGADMFDVIIRKGRDSLVEANVEQADLMDVVRLFAPDARPWDEMDNLGFYANQMRREFGAPTFVGNGYIIQAIPLVDAN